jgi:hypothetical protein
VTRRTAFLAQHEIDRVRGNLSKLRFVTERAFEHGQSARDGGDVQCGGLGVAVELASLGAFRQAT